MLLSQLLVEEGGRVKRQMASAINLCGMAYLVHVTSMILWAMVHFCAFLLVQCAPCKQEMYAFSHRALALVLRELMVLDFCKQIVVTVVQHDFPCFRWFS